MFAFVGDELVITQGDTGELYATITGDEFGSSDKAQVTFAGKDGTIMLQKVTGFTDDTAEFDFDIDDTADIPAGDYIWELRIVKGATVSDGKITAGTSAYTPHNKPMPLRIVDALCDIHEGV